MTTKIQCCATILSFLVLLLCEAAVGQGLRVTVVDTDQQPIAGAVVELMLPDSLRQEYALAAAIQIDQLDKEFVPTVSTVVAGGSVSFPNSDDILHHVYSFSAIKTFNIPLFGKGDANNKIINVKTTRSIPVSAPLC